MTTLERDFEDKLASAILDEVEARFHDPDGPVHQAVDHSHEVLREYGSRHDYNVEPIIDAHHHPTIERGDRYVRATWGWDHEAAPYFEYGTSDHVVDGNPVLVFIWEDAPQSVHEMFPDTERVDGDPKVFLPQTEPSGIPESRFIREGIRFLRRTIQ